MTIRRARSSARGNRTVMAAFDSVWPEPRKKPGRRGSRLDPYRDVIDGWLRDDLKAPRKQRHTAKRIFDRLLDEQHATRVASYGMVRDYVATRRREIRVDAGREPANAFVPQDHKPGAGRLGRNNSDRGWRACEGGCRPRDRDPRLAPGPVLDCWLVATLNSTTRVGSARTPSGRELKLRVSCLWRDERRQGHKGSDRACVMPIGGRHGDRGLVAARSGRRRRLRGNRRTPSR